MHRPDRLVVVVGTGTGVGKTWVSARLLMAARARGMAVAARKPAQSFDPAELGATDAELLALATGEERTDVCPDHRWYAVAMAPPMAAEALGRPVFSVAELLRETTWPAGVGLGLVETAGGPRSPLAHDGDSATLAEAMAPDAVLVVADAGLGTINAVRLTVDALRPLGVTPVVLLNRFDPGDDLHARNLAWLQRREALTVTTAVAETLTALLT